MKKQDFIFIVCCILFFAPFFIVEPIRNLFLEYSSYKDWHAIVMAFLKFGILATLGEVIGLRIQKGVYFQKGFGILPRAIVWGFLGIGISIAMTLFSTGTPAFLANLGVNIAATDFFTCLLIAFCISVAMNTIFAPVFMTFHKITDMHILQTGGTLKGFCSKGINMSQSFKNINWDVQWNFVFKKTIPFFWYPAHTITFMLPGELRVLFAALLGVALGVILSVANMKKK